jgi:predicted nucleotidyltransferase
MTPKVPPTLAYLRAMRDDILALAHAHGAYDVRVFGSVARGEATSNSDVDLLANFHPHSLLQRIALMRELSELVGYRVEVIQEKSLKAFVKPNVLKDAIPL